MTNPSSSSCIIMCMYLRFIHHMHIFLLPSHFLKYKQINFHKQLINIYIYKYFEIYILIHLLEQFSRIVNFFLGSFGRVFLGDYVAIKRKMTLFYKLLGVFISGGGVPHKIHENWAMINSYDSTVLKILCAEVSFIWFLVIHSSYFHMSYNFPWTN